MKMYTLTLSEADVNQILGVLGERPYTEVSRLVTTIFNSAAVVPGTEDLGEKEEVADAPESAEVSSEEPAEVAKGA